MVKFGVKPAKKNEFLSEHGPTCLATQMEPTLQMSPKSVGGDLVLSEWVSGVWIVYIHIYI